MITVNFFEDASYSFDTNKLKSAIEKTLIDNNIKDAVVDLAVVGENIMQKINKKYYTKDEKKHPIFTFPVSQVSNFVYPKNTKNYLGEIIIAEYEVALRGEELASHGTLHLLGIHH